MCADTITIPKSKIFGCRHVQWTIARDIKLCAHVQQARPALAQNSQLYILELWNSHGAWVLTVTVPNVQYV
jgi:hypothetical protein